jgi:hypothetical protein
VLERRGRGVLDRPPQCAIAHKAGDDGFFWGSVAGFLYYRIGGAYWMPPALQSWLRPRGIFSFDSVPTLRS